MRRSLVLLLCASLVFAAAAGAVSRPDITGKTLAGRTLSLKWYRGKWVFVNVWASW